MAVQEEVKRRISQQFTERSFVEVAKIVEAIIEIFPECVSRQDELRSLIVKLGVAKGAPIKF
ncbi:hypothetical protein CHELA1G11_10023 [Hyphomicrobiales bacterium]|nr:hypothetical protein CHELA1G11_10023 [Hyphomicrobiales bacterium]CAH1677615.1 hypothetical protein CHELA1G2_14287 [Hyphomicrobiales bacterium]